MRRSIARPRETIDWKVGRAHVARAASLMEEALTPSPHRIQAILDERARALARAPQQTAAPFDQRDAVVFRLGGEYHAIETRFVREVMHVAHMTQVPHRTGPFLGVTNLRGEILGIVDLHKLLELPEARRAETLWLVILGENHAEFAVPVEAIEEIKPVRIDQVPDAIDWAGLTRRPFVRAVGPDALILLEGKALLEDRRLFVVQSERS
jgi:chemotaxis signal transduction protein